MNQYNSRKRGMSLWDLLFLVGMWVGACAAIGIVAKVTWIVVTFGWGLL